MPRAAQRKDRSSKDLIVTRIRLDNWRNFRSVDVAVTQRMFLAGPNASGKSNFLDAIRFLRDVAKPGGGFQKAVIDRGGVSKVRCLAARQNPHVTIAVDLTDGLNGDSWSYLLSFSQDNNRNPILTREEVSKNGEWILQRPTIDDQNDSARRSQTSLEQINANVDFRPIASFFENVLYLHLVPQIIREPEGYLSTGTRNDPFGRDFMDRLALAPEKTRTARLRKIEEALRLAVPQLTQLQLTKDHRGTPHLSAVYQHWRPGAGQQNEDQFSDGTLRLIGLLWSLLEGEGLLLLEEPELSLHGSVVRLLAPMIHRMQRSRRRQVLVSTHSAELLSDPGIGGEEVLLLFPSHEGTTVRQASDLADVKALLEEGMPISEAALPRTAPERVDQLRLLSV